MKQYLISKEKLIKFNMDNSHATTRTFKEDTEDWLEDNNIKPVQVLDRDKVKRVVIDNSEILGNNVRFTKLIDDILQLIPQQKPTYEDILKKLREIADEHKKFPLDESQMQDLAEELSNLYKGDKNE